MFDFRNYIVNALEENKEIIKELAIKSGLLKEIDNSFDAIEKRCFKILAEHDSLIIYYIDEDTGVFEKLYQLFKDDSRVQFWIDNEQYIVENTSHPRVWVQNSRFEDDIPNKIFDYGEYQVLNKTKEQTSIILVDDIEQKNESKGYVSKIQKEKNLCKLVSKLIAENKEKITIFTFEEDTILYIKGVMKGAGVTNRIVTFALHSDYQSNLIKNLKSEMYTVAPIVTLEKDENWKMLKRYSKKYQSEIMDFVKKKIQ